MRILLPSTLLLYLSTVLYLAAEIWHISSIDTYVSGANAGLFAASYGPDSQHTFQREVEKQSWMLTIALGINASPSPPSTFQSGANSRLWMAGLPRGRHRLVARLRRLATQVRLWPRSCPSCCHSRYVPAT